MRDVSALSAHMDRLTDAGSPSLVSGLVDGLADLASPRDALARVLERIVVTLRFDHAELWEPFGTGVGLGLTMDFPIGSTQYRQLSGAGRQSTQLRGFGLAGLTAESGETTWIADLAADKRFLRGEEADACGLTSAVAFPVSSGDEVLAVILLFSASEVPAGSRLARTLVDVGDRLAPIVKHGRAIERYEQLMDLSPVPVVIHSEGVARYANKAMADLLGASDRSDLVGRPILDFVPESNRAEVGERVTTVLGAISPPDGEADHFVESTWTDLAGKEIEVEVVGTPTTFEDRPAVQVMARDVTDRNRARSALRVSERRYRQIVEAANDGICLIDQLGVVSYCNEPMAAMLGYERDEIVERPARTGLGGFAGLVEVDKPVRAEVEFTRRDGSRGWAVMTVSPVDEPESDDRILLTALDVTATRMAQRQLTFQASILDQVQNAVIATDNEGHIVYWNAAAGQIYGWKADEVMGERVLSVVVPESSTAGTLEVIDEAREKGGWSGELELKRKDGLEFSAHVNGVPVTDEAGEPSGFVVVTTDVSEQ
ncbi:MAG TPA: PAS domain S-box protein, partial [Acidimicrobiia bacterium]|nr:PAS domain S-box protein [Acidimicrobiia bacterium]